METANSVLNTSYYIETAPIDADFLTLNDVPQEINTLTVRAFLDSGGISQVIYHEITDTVKKRLILCKWKYLDSYKNWEKLAAEYISIRDAYNINNGITSSLITKIIL